MERTPVNVGATPLLSVSFARTLIPVTPVLNVVLVVSAFATGAVTSGIVTTKFLICTDPLYASKVIIAVEVTIVMVSKLFALESVLKYDLRDDVETWR